MPPLFAVCLVVLDDLQTALLASFGVIAQLAFADFSGPPRRRAGAYVGLTIVGAGLAALATLLSGSAWAAAVVMAGVAFAITFSSFAGGYLAAGASAAILAFVIAVAVPADAGEIPSRLAGWGLAGVASTVAAIALWPRYERSRLIRRMVDAACACADLVDALADPAADERQRSEARARAAAAGDTLATTYLETPYRPAGPTAHDESLLYLVYEVRRTREFAEELADAGPLTADDASLAAASARALRETATLLADGRGTFDAAALERERAAHRRSVGEQFALERDTERLERRARAAFGARVLSYLALSVGLNAARLRGLDVPAARYEVQPLMPDPGLSSALSRLVSAVRANLRPDSVWFQAALRAAVALGAAVFVAVAGRVEHAFWIALGTMTVLKSSAVTTGYTAWQALLGTLAGFGLASAFLLLGGEARAALWAALPICVFLAIYTPTAVHAIVGNAMFTVTVVVLFNLIEPEGWRTGLIRVENVGIGAATSVVAGLLLWPRGARAQLRSRLASLYEAGGEYMRRAIGAAVGRLPVDQAAGAGVAALESATRASDAFSTFLNERGPKRLPIQTWSRVLAVGYQLRFVGDAVLEGAQALGPVEGRPDVSASLDAAAADLERRIARAGRSIVDRAEERAPPIAAEPLQMPAIVPDGADASSVQTALWVREWIGHVQRLLAEVEPPLRQVQDLGARPWWR